MSSDRKYTRLREVPQEVLEALSKGDESAFSEVYLHYKESLTQFVYFLVHNREDADEISQDIFAALWENRTEITNIKHFKNYLYQAAKYKAFDLLEKHGVAERYNEFRKNTHPGFFDDPEEIYQGKEMALFIELSVGKMPEMQRKVFRMIHDEGLSLAEAAKKLNITYKAADGLYYRAKQSLKELMVYFIILFIVQ